MSRSGSVALPMAALCGLLTAVPETRAADWPETPVPEGAATEYVSKNMLFNGLPMQVSRFVYGGTKQDVIAFYKEEWGDQLVENDLGGGKTVLGHHQGDHFVTVEMKNAGGGVEATVGVMDVTIKKPLTTPGEWLVRPSNTQVLNDLQYLDLPGEPRTLTLQNTMSPAQNYEFYRVRLGGSNWVQDGPGCSIAANSCLVRFKKGGQQLTMTINREQEGTVVIANEAGE